jgi:hypothetical protein
MSSRKPSRRDPVDVLIASTLKTWVGRSRIPFAGRDELLHAAQAEQKHGVVARQLGAMARGLFFALSGIPDALMGEAVFDTYQRERQAFNREPALISLNLMHMSIFYSHTPRLGLFSIVL